MHKEMDKSEQIAQGYLRQQGWSSVVFEPNGERPPDFSVCDELAVEVMRLSRWVESEALTEESISIPLWEMIQEVLRGFDDRYGGKTYWVGLEHGSFAPKSLPADTKEQLKTGLEQFLESERALPYTLTIRDEENNIRLSLTVFAEGTPVKGRTFKLGTQVDTGVLPPDVTLYTENIKRCVAKKSKIIAQYKHEYPRWQLLLVDFLTPGLDPDEVEQVKASITDLQEFDSLVVVNYAGKLVLQM